MLPTLQRALLALGVLALVFTASQALVYGLPGDPVETLLGETATPLSAAELRAELGLDAPFPQRLLHGVLAMAQGDWGRSLIHREPIGPILARRFKATLHLVAATLVLGVLVSLALGVAAASRGGLLAGLCELWGLAAVALPTPWLGPILLWIFSVKLGWLPITGSVWLPALTLSVGFVGLWSRLVRARVAEGLAQNSVLFARSLGVRELRILFKHALLPQSGSLVSYFGAQLGALLGGALVTETVFAWPGIGSYLVDSVLSRDYPSVQAAAFVTASFAWAGTLFGHWAQRQIDPRIEEEAS